MGAGKSISRLVREACAAKPGNVNGNHNFPDAFPEGLPLIAVDPWCDPARERTTADPAGYRLCYPNKRPDRELREWRADSVFLH